VLPGGQEAPQSLWILRLLDSNPTQAINFPWKFLFQ
jgi:hypothetical protein